MRNLLLTERQPPFQGSFLADLLCSFLIFFSPNLRPLSSSANIVMANFFLAYTHAKLFPIAES